MEDKRESINWQDRELVSILVPVYNVEKFLPRCLDSLTAQSWKHLEIILINDGSTDDSLKIARSYASKFPNIRIYSYPNSGISRTRNRALKHARGDFVMFVDSDDYIDPEMVKTMMDEIHAQNLDLVQCGFIMEYGPVKFLRPSSGHHQFSSMEALHALSQGKFLNNYPWGKLTRREYFDGVSFPEDMPGFEDTYTIFKTMIPARRIGTIPDRFYHYVQHSGSLTNNMSLDTVYLMRKAYEAQHRYLQEHFPGEDFSYDLQYYNTDMVIIYTLIVFSRRKENPVFQPAVIDWDKLPFSPVMQAAYQAWLAIARLKLGDHLREEKG